MIEEHDMVVLTCDLPENGLARGDVGVVVHLHSDTAYGVEFVTFDGETLAVLSLTQDQVRPVAPGEMRHARQIESRG